MLKLQCFSMETIIHFIPFPNNNPYKKKRSLKIKLEEFFYKYNKRDYFFSFFRSLFPFWNKECPISSWHISSIWYRNIFFFKESQKLYINIEKPYMTFMFFLSSSSSCYGQETKILPNVHMSKLIGSEMEIECDVNISGRRWNWKCSRSNGTWAESDRRFNFILP